MQKVAWLAAFCVAALLLFFAVAYCAPGRFCSIAPLGDEGEGECLGALAGFGESARCRIADAVLTEVRGSNNDVVIASALDGFVERRACADLAFIWKQLPVGSPD